MVDFALVYSKVLFFVNLEHKFFVCDFFLFSGACSFINLFDSAIFIFVPFVLLQLSRSDQCRREPHSEYCRRFNILFDKYMRIIWLAKCALNLLHKIHSTESTCTAQCSEKHSHGEAHQSVRSKCDQKQYASSKSFKKFSNYHLIC